MHHDLQILLEKMGAALQEAIADAQSAREVNYGGYNGQLLSKSGGRYTYQFTLKTFWDIDENAKICVMDLENTIRIDARVLGRETITLLLATREVLPPEYLPHMLLVEDKVWLLKKQLAALQNLRENSAEFGAKTLGILPVQSAFVALKGKLGNFVPHPNQERAIAHGLGSEKTLIIGPPGTGKTTTLSDLICRYLQGGLSVLLVSHTNIATDNAFLRLIQAMQKSRKSDLLALTRQGLAVRVGEPRHIALREGTYRGLTVNALADARTPQQAEQSAQLEFAYQQLLQKVEQAEQELLRRENLWRKKRTSLLAQIELLSEELTKNRNQQAERDERYRKLLEEQKEREAQAERMLSLLVGGERELHARWLRFEQMRKQYVTLREEAWRELQQVQGLGRLRRIFSRWRNYDEAAQSDLIKRFQGAQEALALKIAEIEEEIYANQQKRSAFLLTREKARNAQLQQKNLEKRSPSPYPSKIAQLEQQLAPLQAAFEQGEAPLTHLQTQVRSQTDECAQIQARLADIKAEQEAIRGRIIAEARLVATTITSAYLSAILLERDFDVVVVDELSMISLPSVVLVASRATRHFVGAGDPTQLVPIVKLEQAHLAPLAREWLGRDLFTYLGISIFDAIRGEKECVFLTEQGRSHPAIVAPINRYIYQNMLTSRAETNQVPGIAPYQDWRLMVVDTTSTKAECIKPGADRPRENRYHAQLCTTLAQVVLSSLPPYTADDDPTVPRIAIIAPYRSQVKLVQDLLRQAKIAHLIHVGTINTVQSLEFPVVIFDTVEAPGGPKPWSFTFDRVLDDQNMATEATRKLNVAWTRARQKLIVIAHRKHLQQHLPRHASHNSKKQRLLVELVEWAAREGCVNAQQMMASLLQDDQGES